jgi:colanic acid biosynthesis glycosyl transferase WcaI
VIASSRAASSRPSTAVEWSHACKRSRPTPLESQKRISAFCRRSDVGFVFWVQDLIGEAAERLLRRRSAILVPVARYYKRLERQLLWNADAVVAISEDFRPHLPSTAEVIENWAPLQDLPLLPKANRWSKAHGLEESRNLLYSGTLGMKHDPSLLVRLARACAEDERARVVVASEGHAAEWLREESATHHFSNLVVLPFQPYEDLAEMLASADILIAILEPDAGIFSVPSKVLTYLCAGRPLLLVVPPENLAARIVSENGAGIVVPPGDGVGLEQGARVRGADV